MQKKVQNSQPVALITGSAQRIGKAVARDLAHQGYSIALHYHRSKKQAQLTAQEIREEGGVCETFSADLLDEKAVQSLIPAVIKKLGRLDLLINNASIFGKSTLRQLDLKDLDLHWRVNFRAPYLLMAIFAKFNTRGHIINMVDTHVTQNQTGHFNYLLSKKSLCDLTRMAAVELGPYIRVNAVAPGPILPPSEKGRQYLQRLSQRVPLRRVGKIEEIAQAVRFLEENEYLTGQVIYVDGGERLM